LEELNAWLDHNSNAHSRLKSLIEKATGSGIDGILQLGEGKLNGDFWAGRKVRTILHNNSNGIGKILRHFPD
jgi:hypothetical protein